MQFEYQFAACKEGRLAGEVTQEECIFSLALNELPFEIVYQLLVRSTHWQRLHVWLQALRTGNCPDVIYCRIRWVAHSVTAWIKPLTKNNGVELFTFTDAMFAVLKEYEKKARGTTSSWENEQPEE